MPDEQGRNDAERWFERYLRQYEYHYIFEPDHLGVPSRPDFLANRGEAELICEVKGFEEAPPLEKRLAGLNQPAMVSDDEVYGAMRGAVREAARQLKPLAGSPWPLIVVLANPTGFYVHLDLDRLIEAMYGNPRLTGTFNPESGEIEGFEFEYGRDGRLRNDHPYISGVAIVHELSLAAEYHAKWLADWKSTREQKRTTYDEIAAEAVAAHEAWLQSEARIQAPEGEEYWIDLLTTGSPEAVPVPTCVFDGPRDRRVSVERVLQH
jgi:hypothetical protein